MLEVKMPRLTESMEEGMVLSWLAESGAEVTAGDDLLEIETDKATMTHPAEAAGVLEIVVPEGETVSVGTVLARIGAGSKAAAPAPEAPEEPGDPAPTQAAAATATEADAGAAEADGDAEDAGRPAATPLAARIAGVRGIALASIEGSGIGGRVTKRDVLVAAGVDPGDDRTPAAAPDPAAPAVPPAAKGDQTVVPMSRLQQTIARRMAEAKATVPHLQVQTDVVMDDAIELRRQVKSLGGDGPVPSLNDLVIKACALALREHPRANGSYRDGEFVLHRRINVGMAVAAEDALLVPVVPDADISSLGEIARRTARLAARVREGEITPPELAGGTFTVSNLGMFGMTAITPVVNPPQAAILGVGAARPVLARDGAGEIVERQMATMTLSCDHRILYGADAARFLSAVKQRLEAPMALSL